MSEMVVGLAFTAKMQVSTSQVIFSLAFFENQTKAFQWTLSAPEKHIFTTTLVTILVMDTSQDQKDGKRMKHLED